MVKVIIDDLVFINEWNTIKPEIPENVGEWDKKTISVMAENMGLSTWSTSIMKYYIDSNYDPDLEGTFAQIVADHFDGEIIYDDNPQ